MPDQRAGGFFSGRGYVLAVLTALSAMNQLDRQIMNILVEPIRREFGLSDIQLGLLSGLAFVAFYSVLSVPAAIFAMTRSRRTSLAVSAAVWGAMTFACGLAQSYTQLLLARLGVGVGEAGGMPPSHAIISDLYAPHERATAMATWSAGINIGIFFAYLGGGFIGYRYGWRMAFFAAGGLTIALACLLRFTVREPARVAEASAAPPTLSAIKRTLLALWSDPVLRHICVGATITTIVGYSALVWIPSFLIRSHGMTIASAGAYLAIVAGAGGALGTWLGGKWSDALRRRDIRWSLWLIALIFAAAKPINIGFLTIDATAIALALFVLPAMLATTFLGPSVAVIHNRVDSVLRPLASALFLLLVNLVGLGIGPLLTGAMSQWVFSGHGADSLRYALVVTQLIGFWGAAHFYLAGRNLNAAATSS